MAGTLDIAPSKTEFLSRTRAGNLVPVSCELPADLETPISVFLKLRGEGNAFLLESVERLYDRLRAPLLPPNGTGGVEPIMDTDMPVATFLGAVKTAKEYIRAGDI